MSAIPVVSPTPTPEKRRKHRARHRHTGPGPSVRVRTAPRAKAKSRLAISSKLITFAIIVGFTFMASSLAGQVLVEKARREGIRATERARDARKAEAVLRQQVDALQSLDNVEAWATAHGFTAPDGIAAGGQIAKQGR
jgi:hypothetical protein